MTSPSSLSPTFDKLLTRQLKPEGHGVSLKRSMGLSSSGSKQGGERQIMNLERQKDNAQHKFIVLFRFSTTIHKNLFNSNSLERDVEIKKFEVQDF